MNEILEQITPFLVSAVLAIVGWAMKHFWHWLTACTSNEWLKRLILEAEIITLDLWENVTKDIKTALADGHITPEEYKKIQADAKARAMNRLKEILGDAPAQIQDNLRGKLDAIVESAVAKINLRFDHIKAKLQGKISPLDEAQP